MIVRKMSQKLADAFTEKHFYEFTPWRQLYIRRMLIRGRERTGIMDANRVPIYSGDILETHCNEHYPRVMATVVWSAEKAAFIRWYEFESGGGSSSLNLEDAKNDIVVGNIYKNPDLLVRAKRVKE